MTNAILYFDLVHFCFHIYIYITSVAGYAYLSLTPDIITITGFERNGHPIAPGD